MRAAGAAVHELAAAAVQGVELCAWLLRGCERSPPDIFRCCVTDRYRGFSVKTSSRNRYKVLLTGRAACFIMFFSVPLVALVILASVLSPAEGSETSVGMESDDD